MKSDLLPSDRVDMKCAGCETMINYRIDLRVKNFEFFCNNCYFWNFEFAEDGWNRSGDVVEEE